jgi:hypothetical protein
MPIKPFPYRRGEGLGLKNPWSGKEATRTRNITGTRTEKLPIKDVRTGRNVFRTKGVGMK